MNNSGLTPVEYKCVVRPLEIEETDAVLKGAKSAGIIIPKADEEREQMAQVNAEFIAAGGSAFSDWIGPVHPNQGDIIMVNKYAGYVVKGKDGMDYRIINDKDILAILEK
jgi:co-chaperonin GroES (HSP10)